MTHANRSLGIKPRYSIRTFDLRGRRYDREYAVVDNELRAKAIEHSILQTNDLARAILCRDENNRR
jgi:hypothetical protein